MVERLRNLKTCLKNRQGEFKRTEIVLIRVHLETGRWLTVVQRSKVSFVRETGRFVLYPGELACMLRVVFFKGL